jgi:hypothetical protein
MIGDRFQVLDPVLRELVEAFPDRGAAYRCAQREASRHRYGMTVFDLLAHQGQPESWNVLPSGEVQIGRRKPCHLSAR